MSRLDDRLTRELDRVARPADPTRAFERVDHKRARRSRMRRVRAGALAVVVITGTVGGFTLLSNTFKEPGKVIGGQPQVQNGSIVYSQVRDAGQPLWVVLPDGTGAHQLTAGDGSSDYGPSVSPDGTTVAFDRTDQNGTAIYTIGIDGTGLRRIADAPALDPAWSPDSARIAYERGALGPKGIWTMNPDGSDPTLIPGTDTLDTGNPSWSPDGASIAFEGAAFGSVGELTWDLYTVPLDATSVLDLHRLTSTPDLNEIMPSWSPDGTRIVFSQVSTRPSADRTGGVAFIAADGGGVHLVTTGGPGDLNPAWSPDGSLIAFDRSSSQALSVYTVRPDGTDLTKVVDGMDPAWQPIASGVDPSPVRSPTSTNSGPLDLGLGFPVCDPRPIQGDFDGDGRVDTATVVTKMSDAGGCPAPASTTNIVVLDTNGDGKADASIGPIACDPWCFPYASPDLNDDRRAELVVDQGHLASPVSAALSVYELSGPLNGVWTFPDGSMTFDVSDGGSVYMAGAFCSTDGSGQPLFTIWEAPTADGGSTYDLVERNYRFDLPTLRFRLDSTTHDTLTSSSPWPEDPAQTDTLCGAPAAPLG